MALKRAGAGLFKYAKPIDYAQSTGVKFRECKLALIARSNHTRLYQVAARNVPRLLGKEQLTLCC
jgi:hypothetical protein